MNARSMRAEEFHAQVAGQGGIVLETSWLGVHKPHRVRCSEGHECSPHPSSIKQGKGICRVCAGLDPITAEAEFHVRIAKLGGTILESTWLGVHKPHRVRCSAGHECLPRPTDVRRGQGICRVCGGNDPITAEAEFRARITELGGIVLESTWLGARKSHRVRCSAGHECSPKPNNMQQGEGICRICAGLSEWDVFYIVANESHVKFGITTGDPRSRLNAHRSAGYTDVIRVLAISEAIELERNVLATMKFANIRPVKGREYFDLSVLAIVLDVVDHWSNNRL